MSANHEKPTPGWVAFLFWGLLVVGGLYAVFAYGFLNTSNEQIYRSVSAASDAPGGGQIVVPTIDIVPVRTAETIGEGEKVYAQVCVACHGANLEGGVGPNLADNEWWHNSDEKAMAKLVINGISAAEAIGPTGTPMPPKGGGNISNEDVWKVIYYLSSKNGSIEQNAEPTPGQ